MSLKLTGLSYRGESIWMLCWLIWACNWCLKSRFKRPQMTTLRPLSSGLFNDRR